MFPQNILKIWHLLESNFKYAREICFDDINEAGDACLKNEKCSGFVSSNGRYCIRGSNIVKQETGEKAWLKKFAKEMKDNKLYSGPSVESITNCSQLPDVLYQGYL